MQIPTEMNAVTIARFGGPEVLLYGRQPIPAPGPNEVLVQVAHAGVGTWDPLEREGGLAEITGEDPTFPITLGGDGAGIVVAIGSGVDRHRIGDAVYGLGSGFYAEYVRADERTLAPIPIGLDMRAAAGLPIVALTALRGLVDQLQVGSGESVLVNGASGDVGLMAVQLAKILGARVLAVASGDDGVEVARTLGADATVDGHSDGLRAALRTFAPNGLDAMLSLVGGPSQDAGTVALRPGGRLAFPLGVTPAPRERSDVSALSFDITTASANETEEGLRALGSLIGRGTFVGPVSTSYPLARAREAHLALRRHRVGKILLDLPHPQ